MSSCLIGRRLDSLFVRVYVGVLVAVLVLVFLSSLLITQVNRMRLAVHQEALLGVLMTSLKPHLAETQASQAWLDEQAALLGFQLQSLPIDALVLSRYEQRRLRLEKRPLVFPQHNTLLAYLPLAESDQVLKIDVQWPQERLLKATTYFFSLTLREKTPEARLQALDALAKQLPYPLQQSHAPWTAPFLNLHYDEAKKTLTAFEPLDQTTWLQLGPFPLFKPYPWPLLISILFFALVLLGLSIGWFLYRLDQRLRLLERVSSQLASGNLTARLSEENQDFIGKLAFTFNHMAEQIQRLLRTQQEMIHAVSHELRTPVARLRFGLQMIEDLSEADPLRAQIMRQAEGMDRDIDELDTLIDEILTYARLGQEKLELQFVEQEVVGLLEEVVSSFQRVNPHLKLVLKVINPQALSTEAQLEGRYFQRAIQNLLGNAVRYAKSEIHVSCDLEAATLRVDVEDDGPGIPPADWARVFMPFSRLDDSRTRRSGGYGLGLSIVQRITYWHQGSALVDSSPTLGGARFSLIFPKHQEA